MNRPVEYLVPPGWNWSAIETVTSYVQRGKSPKYTGRSSLPVINQRCVRWHGVEAKHLKFIDQSQWEAWGPERTLRDGDILWNSTGTGTIGRAAIYRPLPGFERVVADSHVTVIRVKNVLPEYLHAWIRSPCVQARIDAMQVGSTNQVELGRGEVLRTRVPVAPANEQRRIVAKLEALQERSRRAREALDAVPPLLEKLRRSILAAAFRGDLTKDWRAKQKNIEPATELLQRIRAERREKWEATELAKLKSKGRIPTDDRWKAKYPEPDPLDGASLPALTGGWCWASVEEIGLIESGQTTDGLAEHPSSGQKDVPWFRVGDMNHPENQVVMRVSDVWLSESEVRRFGLHVRPEGTIVFPKRGGAIATNKKRRLAQPSAYDLNTMGIIPIDSIATYVWIWFQLVDLGKLNTGTAVPQINHGDIAPLAIPIPPTAEASRIAEVVTDKLNVLRNIGELVAGQTAQLQQLNRAVLAKAFRGELVPQDPNDEPAETMLARARSTNGSTPPANGSRPKGGRARAAKRAEQPND